jgi:hypothetical protein
MTPGEMSFEMSQNSKLEVLEKMRERYGRRGRQGRGKLIDEVVALCGYSRKHAIKVLGGQLPIVGKRKRHGGPAKIYGEGERAVVKPIWLSAEQPCGKRLKETLGLWVPYYEQENGVLEEGLKKKVLAMSAATLDRLLGPCRVALGSRRRCGTRPGTLLRKDIPVRTEHWDVSGPGWMEADTVAHCGESMAGDFCWSVTVTDVFTQWTETRAVWNKGQHAVRERIKDLEETLVFPILGFDSDNGGEFLNWHLRDYFLEREKPVEFTRSRPYHKNDNARVEQKNWTHVRQLVGYGRLDNPEQAELLNDLYAKEWSNFRNFFCPAMKHLRTEVEGSRKKRIYDKPATPFERLKASGVLSGGELANLERKLRKMNPFEMKRNIERKLRRVLKLGSRLCQVAA